MFDRHIHQHSTEVTQRVTEKVEIKEFKAPTDETIKLLREMEREAVKNILAHVKVEQNNVTGQAWVIKTIDKSPRKLTLVFKFNINGNDYHIEKEFNDENDLAGINFFGDFDENTRKMRAVEPLTRKLGDWTKALLAYYTITNLVPDIYREFTGMEMPSWVKEKFIR